jgi:hypothetical protein
MPEKPIIWIIDTSIFLNVLDVPQFNQNREEVLADFERKINAENSFLLPFTSIIETGNHIAQINNGNQRRQFAQKFVSQVTQALEGQAPWKPLAFPKEEQLKTWLSSFPDSAQAQKGLGDHMIIKQWEEQCEQFKAYSVRIWSMDGDLQGYECNS